MMGFLDFYIKEYSSFPDFSEGTAGSISNSSTLEKQVAHRSKTKECAHYLHSVNHHFNDICHENPKMLELFDNNCA